MRGFRPTRDDVGFIAGLWVSFLTLVLIVASVVAYASGDSILAAILGTLAYFTAIPMVILFIFLVATFVYWLIAKRG